MKVSLFGGTIAMLMEGNTCPVDDLVELGISPIAFNAEHLGYLRA